MKDWTQIADFNLAVQGIISFCVLVIFLAIFLDFMIFSKKEHVVKEKKSIVETGTMTLFFLIDLVVLKLRIGRIDVTYLPLKNIAILVGLFFIVLGCIVNVSGRFRLGHNWANHIKIYETHQLIHQGVYHWVRHPLYASIMLMLIGGALVYRDALSLSAIILIFIPFMYYRAKQEEVLLNQYFPEYQEYKKKTGMFFPKIKR